jgi:hypothetical protein
MSELSPSERALLREVCGALVPADAGLGMPGADDPAIQADISKSIGRDLPAIRAALASFASLTGRSDAALNAWYASGGMPARLLGRLVLSAYYRDDRVLMALGHEARAPFPKGYVVEPGDWSLLDPVKQRPAFWRRDA